MVEQSIAPPVFRAIDSLRRGISRFAGQTSVGTVFNTASLGFNFLADQDKIRVIDPSGVLEPHKEFVRQELKDRPAAPTVFRLSEPGIHVVGIKSETAFVALAAKYDSSVESDVINSWLGIALSNWQWFTHNPEAARALEHYASRSVDSVIRAFRASSQHGHSEAEFEISYILEEIARISRGVEEGKGATGKIAFIPLGGPVRTISTERDFANGSSSVSYERIPESMTVLAMFREAIPLNEHKRIVKSLQITKSSKCLIADHTGLHGVIDGAPADSLFAEFNRGIVDLSYNSRPICRIAHGEILYVLKTPDILLSPWLGKHIDCNKLVMSVVDSCRRDRHGATLVLVEAIPEFPMTGQKLDSPIYGPPEFIAEMSSVDGAVLIDLSGKVYGYGYILDGQADPTKEVLARGARFNSALRFSALISNGFVLVVSEDGPLTLFERGDVRYADPLSMPDSSRGPEKAYSLGTDIDDWLKN